jgi:hypothetical protein
MTSRPASTLGCGPDGVLLVGRPLDLVGESPPLVYLESGEGVGFVEVQVRFRIERPFLSGSFVFSSRSGRLVLLLIRLVAV